MPDYWTPPPLHRLLILKIPSLPPILIPALSMLHSHRFEDSLIHVDRILAIEAIVDNMRSQNEATHRLLQDVLNKLGPAQARKGHCISLLGTFH